MDLLWTDFLNSECHDWRGNSRTEDRLDKPEWLAEFVAKWNLSAPIPPKPDELSALKGFRSLLHRMTKHLVAGTDLTPDDLRELNRVMEGGASPAGSRTLMKVTV